MAGETEWSRRHGAFVAAGAALAQDVALGPGAVVHEDVSVGSGSRIGSGAVLHPGCRLGRDVLVEDRAVLGKQPRLRPGSSAAGALGELIVDDGVTVCCGAVLYAGAQIGFGCIVGDLAGVRERARLGERTVIGRTSTIDFDVVVGDRVLIQTGVYLTAGSVVEDDAFLGPGVTTTNDDTMARHAPGPGLFGVRLGRACRVGGGVVLCPGVVVGEEAFIAAGAVVVADVGAREVVMGVPGRVVRQVGDEDLLERWR